MNKDKLLKDQFPREDLEKATDDIQSTTFKSVEYKGIYDLDKQFSVKSEKAYILDEDPDLLFMKKMRVQLYLNDLTIVTIISDEGRFQKKTNDIWFEKNVIADDGETKIFAENLDLLATENFAKIYNNVELYHPTGGSLKSDAIDYDFEKKYMRIYNFDDKAVKMKVIK